MSINRSKRGLRFFFFRKKKKKSSAVRRVLWGPVQGPLEEVF
jgi:hypothetical protein